MGNNESTEARKEPRVQQQATNQAANRGNRTLTVHPLKPSQQRYIPAVNVGVYDMNNRGTVVKQHSRSKVYSPLVVFPTSNRGISSTTSPSYLPRKSVVQWKAQPFVVEDYGSPITTTGQIGKRQIIDVGRPNGRSALEKRLQNAPIILPPAADFPVSQYDPGLYNNRYHVDVKQGPYVHSSAQVYPRGYSTERLSSNAYKYRDPQNTRYNYQKPGVVVSRFEQHKEVRTPALYNNSTRLATDLVDSAEKRKFALKNLLIRPIVQMKGEAWNDNEWMEVDVYSFRNFHASCTEFLSIIELTEDQKMAADIKEFLCSDELTPRYIAENHPPEPDKKLNHFHVFWNLMHQLPFAVKTWDEITTKKLKLFYEVWVTTTMQCGYCRGHYKKWIQEYPPVVTDRSSLNQWMFRLHNDVNQRTNKPQFEWGKYSQRWGPVDHQSLQNRKRSESKNSTPMKSTSSKYNTPEKNITVIYSPPQMSGHSRTSSYGSNTNTRSAGPYYRNLGVNGTSQTSRLSPNRQQERVSSTQGSNSPSSEDMKTRSSQGSYASMEATVRELTGLNIDEELATLKRYKPPQQLHYSLPQQPHYVVPKSKGPVVSLPRRCLSRKNLLHRRRRVNMRSKRSLPRRRRVARRGRGSRF